MMLIQNGICYYEGKYAALNKNICHSLVPSPSALFENSKIFPGFADKEFVYWIMYPENSMADGIEIWILFPGLT